MREKRVAWIGSNPKQKTKLVETPCMSRKKLLRLKIWFYITESHLNTSYKIGGCLCGRRKGVKEICPDNKS